MVTIPVKDYNALIDKALGNSVYLKKVIKKIKSLYTEEKNNRCDYKLLSVNQACDLIIAKIDSKTDLPEAVKEWEDEIK